MVVVGNIYTYKELCRLRNEKERTGKSKQLQLENWKRYFEWTNPTRQKYLITKAYEIPKEKSENRGGARTGAGTKGKLTEEFEYLLNGYLYDVYRKNAYYRHYGFWDMVYFNNDDIAKHFGVYKDLYGIEGDIQVKKSVHAKIADKLREKCRGMVLERMKKADGIELGYGIIAYKKKGGFPYFKDEWLEQWLDAQQRYFEKNEFRNERDVIVAGRWMDMVGYITRELSWANKEDFEVIKRYRKLTFDADRIEPYDYEKLQECRKKVSKKVFEDVYAFFLKKEKEAVVRAAEEQELQELIKELKEEKPKTEKPKTGTELDMDELMELLNAEDTKPDLIALGFDEEKVMEPYRYILKHYVLIE